MSYVITKSGRRVYFNKENLQTIYAKDIVDHWTRQVRFMGATVPASEWNVCSHSMLISMLFIKFREEFNWPLEWLPYVLLHDGHEAYTNDLAGPVKRHVSGLKGVEDALDRDIRGYFNLDLTVPDVESFKPVCRVLDLAAMIVEVMDCGNTHLIQDILTTDNEVFQDAKAFATDLIPRGSSQEVIDRVRNRYIYHASIEVSA